MFSVPTYCGRRMDEIAVFTARGCVEGQNNPPSRNSNIPNSKVITLGLLWSLFIVREKTKVTSACKAAEMRE